MHWKGVDLGMGDGGRRLAIGDAFCFRRVTAFAIFAHSAYDYSLLHRSIATFDSF